LVYLVLIGIVIFNAPSGRARWILAAVWCLGVVALLMLVRFWRDVQKETHAAASASSNNRWKGP
jgi:hypothetical protein